ncbi:hypothetical protein [Flavobacterium pectinovorum]|uniref:SagB/ThcOx family dehydrogenase n=2 Tax=Flavobacterium pectinovorum TaxID=29533 RepID=A0ABY1J5T9_9FLAO|nr:hypothetical protein [Flavobacterium pectinovorum]SHM79259.1 hypothetical protein SAMN05444387_3202 [Flavobacterium pectinovorum]
MQVDSRVRLDSNSCGAASADIDRLLYYSYALFTSSGWRPYSIIPVLRSDLNGMLYPQTCSSLQLLIVQRTDTENFDSLDYFTHSKDMAGVASENQLPYITAYRYMLMSSIELNLWCEQAVNDVVLKLELLALQSGLSLQAVAVDPERVDRHLGLSPRRLKSYCIFDIVRTDHAAGLYTNN